jgi:hypothetical protein
MRMSCLITTLNPMMDVTNRARLTQSPAFIFIGCSPVIIEKGRATFTLFLPLRDLFLSLRDTNLPGGRDHRAGRCPCRPSTHNLRISQASDTSYLHMP